MRTSINTAIFAERLNNGESQISCLKNLGDVGNLIDNIQVRGEFFNDDSKDDELEKISYLAKQKRWGLYYSVPEELFLKDQSAPSFKDNLEMAKKYQIKHLKYFIGDASKISKEAVERLNSDLEEAGVDLTLENLSNETGDLSHVKKGLNLIQNMNKIGFTFDAGNWYWVDENPNTAFEELKERITNFHLKDIKDKTTTMLGDGITDWKSMVHELKADIPIFLEYDIPDDKIADQIRLVNSEIDKR